MLTVSGLVILPAFLSQEKQRQLVKWSLSEHAKDPNPTNLDVHYLLPKQGLWNSYLRNPDEIIHPRPAGDSEPEPAGPRQLINNPPASPDNFQTLHGAPKPPPAPSSTSRPSTCAKLLPKLRWANIGWFYHWGSKQYDFTQGKGEIHPDLRNVCQSAVAAVNWQDVYGNSDWGGAEEEWRNWGESYGTYHISHINILN